MSYGEDAYGAEPLLEVPAGSAAPGLAPSAFDPRRGAALVWLADIEAALGGGTSATGGRAYGEDAFGAEPPAFAPAAGNESIRVSDRGWRSRASDVGGLLAYPPLLIGGPDIERRVALQPGGAGSYAWGAVRLASPGRLPGVSLAGRDTAQRRVRIRAGLQGWDPLRDLVTDPPAARLVDAFLGLAGTWQPREDGAEVPLRDPSAWLDVPIGIRRFLGTGGAEGPAELAGVPFPIVRGGTVGAPVRSIPVVLVHAASRIYRWTDGAGSLVQVYEDGAPVYTFGGDVADVFAAGAPAAGSYISSNAQGMFRLGSDPAGQVTVDGAGGSGPLLAAVLRDLLMVHLGLPAGLLDEGSVLGTASVAPYAGGWAWSGQETARDALRLLLAGLGAQLVASRSGGLRLWPLRALPAAARPVARIDAAIASSVVPVPLEAPLMPPAAAWSVGYGRTHATTTTPKATVSAAERERLARPYRAAAWSDAVNLSRYAQASRPDLLETALLTQADANNLAQAIGALWGVPRRLWRVEMPAAWVLLREIGDPVWLEWPADGLRSGALGQVVGDSIRAGDSAGSLLILV